MMCALIFLFRFFSLAFSYFLIQFHPAIHEEVAYVWAGTMQGPLCSEGGARPSHEKLRKSSSGENVIGDGECHRSPSAWQGSAI